MTNEDIDYFAQRMRDEEAAAAASRSAAARDAHLALAQRYDAVIRAYRPLLRNVA